VKRGQGVGQSARRIGAGPALMLALTIAAGLALPVALGDDDAGLPAVLAPEVALAAVDAPCGGEPMPEPDQVVTGSFGDELEGGYVFVPFNVPAEVGGAAVTALRVKYCYDQPDMPTAQVNHTLDLGLYEPRADTTAPWGVEEFRGWGGSSHPDVTLSADGFEAADGATTRAFLPGNTPAGEWAAELGVAAVASETEGDSDGEVAWRVEVDFLTAASFADQSYEETLCADGGRCDYDRTPANPEPGWYSGDLHVHGEHSALRDAPLEEVFGYSFCPDPDPALEAICDEELHQPGAGLDFITLSDYVGGAQWGEIGRFQPKYPGKLIIPSAEVITYRGHTNAHGITAPVDYRTGPLHELQGDGSTVQVRDPRPASEIFELVQAREAEPGFTQINHPTIFPSEVPGFDSLCRGCPWDYSDAETDYSQVDAIEVATGPAGAQDAPGQPGPNPFTLTAIRFWEDAIDAGGTNANKIAAVGVSDSHNAGRRNDPVTQAPIGQAQTVVFADELSAEGIQEGVLAGHTYVKIWGADGPDLRLEATAEGAGPPAMIGDTLAADSASFTARVMNLDQARAARAGAYTLSVVRDGLPFSTVPIPEGVDEFSHEFEGDGPARYRVQVDRAVTGVASIEALSSPIYLEAPLPGGGDPGGGDPGDGDPGDGDPADDDPGDGGDGDGDGSADGDGDGAGDDGAGGGSAPGLQQATPACANALKGTKREDELVGTSASERIHGRRGADRIRGRAGGDCLRGGGGNDRIWAGAGHDSVGGGPGNDRIHAGDGKRDVIHCGAGRRDRVRADRFDRLRGCERTQRA